jgi:hypothetical protein
VINKYIDKLRKLLSKTTQPDLRTLNVLHSPLARAGRVLSIVQTQQIQEMIEEATRQYIESTRPSDSEIKDMLESLGYTVIDDGVAKANKASQN